MLPRFNYVAKNIPEALAYYRNRAIQLLVMGWSWDGSYIDLGWGIQVQLELNGTSYSSVYVLDKGKGHLINWFRDKERNFVTMEGCEAMHHWLKAKQIPFTLAKPYSSEAYDRVTEFYGDRRAERSNQFYMNHIDEGIYILDQLGASKAAKDAYCLHPIYQKDDDLAALYQSLYDGRPVAPYSIDDPLLIILAMEYRNMANAYLSCRKIESIEEIVLSPIEVVNTMLWADKIQNRKDFEIYHRGKHPRSDELSQYFQNWFDRLGISEELYKNLVGKIDKRTGESNQ
jgi:hypothetical protein